MKIGIIGGTGLEKSKLFSEARHDEIYTKYGYPSSMLIRGNLNGVETVLINRHGFNHTINPSNINYQANIEALRLENCSHIIATSACGSLQSHIKPGDFVILDQFIDRTTKRKQSFFEKDQVAHIPMSEPFCSKLRSFLIQGCNDLGISNHNKGTIVVIEGPRFSTRAESLLYKSWNADVVGMTTVPESVLAREAGICYATIAMATDYDCFMEDRQEVTLSEVLAVMKENSQRVVSLISNVVPKLKDWHCKCQTDIKTSILG